jgi:hypothetical protein
MPEVKAEKKVDIFERELDRQKIAFCTPEGLGSILLLVHQKLSVSHWYFSEYELSIGQLDERLLNKYTAALTTKIHGALQQMIASTAHSEVQINEDERDVESPQSVFSKSAASRLSRRSNSSGNDKGNRGSQPSTKIAATVSSSENGGELYVIGQLKLKISSKHIAMIKKSDSTTTFIHMLTVAFPNGRLGLAVHRRPMNWISQRGGNDETSHDGRRISKKDHPFVGKL